MTNTLASVALLVVVGVAVFLLVRRERQRTAAMTSEELELHAATKEHKALVWAAETDLRTTSRTHDRQMAQAQKALNEAHAVGQRFIRACGGVSVYEDRVQTPQGTAYFKDGEVRADVDSAGNVAMTSRPTVTRIVAGGLVGGRAGAVVAGAALPKKRAHDYREVYLMVETPAFGSAVLCRANDGHLARQTALDINAASRNWQNIVALRQTLVAQASARLDAVRQEREIVVDNASRRLAAATVETARLTEARRRFALLAPGDQEQPSGRPLPQSGPSKAPISTATKAAWVLAGLVGLFALGVLLGPGKERPSVAAVVTSTSLAVAAATLPVSTATSMVSITTTSALSPTTTTAASSTTTVAEAPTTTIPALKTGALLTKDVSGDVREDNNSSSPPPDERGCGDLTSVKIDLGGENLIVTFVTAAAVPQTMEPSSWGGYEYFTCFLSVWMNEDTTYSLQMSNDGEGWHASVQDSGYLSDVPGEPSVDGKTVVAVFPLSRLSELRTPFRWDAAIEWSSGDLTYQDFVPERTKDNIMPLLPFPSL